MSLMYCNEYGTKINIKPDILMNSHKVPMSIYKYIIIITMNKSVDNTH